MQRVFACIDADHTGQSSFHLPGHASVLLVRHHDEAPKGRRGNNPDHLCGRSLDQLEERLSFFDDTALSGTYRDLAPRSASRPGTDVWDD
jgi:hypothetical protein